MSVKAKGHALRIGRVSEPGRIYLITTVTEHRRPVFQDLQLGRLLVDTLRHTQSHAETLAFVIMPDHLHWLMQLNGTHDLSAIVGYVKSESARCINKHMNSTQRLWQRGFHDHALRRDEDLPNVARYVIANPLRAGLVDKIGNYPLWDAVWL